jgi:hypothetical protein
MGILSTRKRQLNDILQHFPSIDIEFEWDGEDSYYVNDFHEVTFKDYYLILDVSIQRTGIIISATYENPEEYIQKSCDVFLFIRGVFEGENEIFFNKNQIKKLTKTIEKYINL